MKLLHSRALLSASRSLRSCREYCHRYTPSLHSIPHQCRSQRSLTTKTPPSSNSPSTNQPTKDETLSLSTQVRLLMRRVPYPVAIITSTDPTPSTSTSTSPHSQTSLESTSESQPTTPFRGMTVSSFNTVTLTPEPVICFNVRRPSETLNALLSSGRFLVHLLSPNSQTASLARDFARGNQNLALGEGMFEFVGVEPDTSDSRGAGKGGGGDKGSTTPAPLPMLRYRDTAGTKASSSGSESGCFPFIVECRLLPASVSQVYDHTIVVGRIVRAITSSESTHSSEDLCLTYANTKFWEVGKEIV